MKMLLTPEKLKNKIESEPEDNIGAGIMYEYTIDRNVDGHPIVFGGVSLDKKEIIKHLNTLSEALGFYGLPETYHAISILTDPPCGEFAEDFSDNNDYDYPKPGKTARNAFIELYGPIVNN